MVRHKPTEEPKRDYNPNDSLANYFEERLQLFKIQDKVKEGKDLSDNDKKRLSNSARKKNYILNEIIFPSFTNLIYFFETIFQNPKLRELFEDDLIDLLEKSPDIPHQTIMKPQMGGVDVRETFLTRLVQSMIMINPDDSKKIKDYTDFRRHLAQDLQSIVYGKMSEILRNDYGFWAENQLIKSVNDDITKVLQWIVFSTKAAEYKKETLHKKLAFKRPKILGLTYYL